MALFTEYFSSTTSAPLVGIVAIRTFRRFSFIFGVTFFVLAAVAGTAAAQVSEDLSNEAIKIFNDGQEAHEKGDFTAAIALYQQALKILPEFPEAELQKGNAHMSLGQTEHAERSFRRAVELRADWTLALSSLGAVLVSDEKFEEARPILVKSIALDDQNFPALSALTELLITTKARPEEMRPLLAKLVSLTAKANPTGATWAARGALENALGDLKSARASFSRARQMDPRNRSAIAGLAEIALTENDTQNAREMLETLKKLNTDSDGAKILEARILVSEERTDEALKILETVKRSQRAAAELRSAINTDRSTNVAELKEQLDSDPKNIGILGRLCSLNRVSDPAAALEYCRRASEADPQNVKHAVGYGAALVQAKRFAEAVTLLTNLLKFAPDNVTLRANLATALFQLRRYAEAKPEFHWLVNKQPDRPIGYYFLAITHDQLQEYIDAMANYQSFLRLADPEQQKLEIEKVNLRLPALQKFIKEKKGKRR